jgi:hypothetical protein
MAVPALTRLTELPARRMQQDVSLEDLPQDAPKAPDVLGQAPEETDTPRLADTGLETLLLAYLGAVLATVGLAAFAVLRKARGLLGPGGRR